jgi:ATP-binding cassette subfamily B multidrug efflux pump
MPPRVRLRDPMDFFRDPDFRATLRRDRTRIRTGFAFLLGRSGFGVVLPLLVGLATDSVFASRPARETLVLIGWFVVCATAAAVCQYFMRLILVAESREYELSARATLFRKLLSLSGGFFDRSRTGDLLSRLTSDVEAVRMGVGPGVMYIVDTGLRSLCAVAFMFHASWPLAACAVLPIAGMVVAMKGVLRAVQDLSLKVQEEQGLLSARAQESFSGARVVKAFGREEAECRRFAAMSEKYVDVNLQLARARALFTCLIESAGAAVMVLILVVGGREVLAGRLTVGGLMAFMAYLNMLVWPMIAFGWVLGLWQRAKASVQRLDDVRREVPEVAEPPAAYVPPGPVRGAIEFRGLTFRRPGAAHDALSDVRLTVPAGGSLGVVGRTGSGKTTLVQFLARLVEPPPNTVFVDGVDVREWSLDALRGAVGFVPQETLLFSDTIANNVAFGMARPDPDRIAEAVRRACLDEAVADFPDGLNTTVGERGVTLSGGQRQRTAIARALAIDPPILVLDDCLSAVDAETEEKILDRLTDVLRSRTAIVVSHRASAVSRLDRVVVLDQGRVVEVGAPDELVAAGGAFAELVRLQRMEEELETL